MSTLPEIVQNVNQHTPKYAIQSAIKKQNNLHVFLQQIADSMTNYSENVFIIPLQFGTLIMKAVADTGAFSSSMSKKYFDKIRRNLYQKPEKTNLPEINVSTAFLHQSPILFTVQLTFKIGYLQFEEHFMKFETLSAILPILLGFPFFDKYEIIIDAHNRLLQTPEFNFQLKLKHIKGNNKQKRLNSRKKS